MGPNHDFRNKVDNGTGWLLRVMLCKQMAHVLSLTLRFSGYKSKDSGGQRQGQTGEIKQEQRGFLVELQMSHGNSERVKDSVLLKVTRSKAL